MGTYGRVVVSDDGVAKVPKQLNRVLILVGLIAFGFGFLIARSQHLVHKARSDFPALVRMADKYPITGCAVVIISAFGIVVLTRLWFHFQQPSFGSFLPLAVGWLRAMYVGFVGVGGGELCSLFVHSVEQHAIEFFILHHALLCIASGLIGLVSMSSGSRWEIKDAENNAVR